MAAAPPRAVRSASAAAGTTGRGRSCASRRRRHGHGRRSRPGRDRSAARRADDHARRRSVEVAAQLQVAVERDADRPRPREVKRGRWQRPQDLTLVREPLGDGEPAVAWMRRLQTPSRQRAYCSSSSLSRPKPPGRPEPALEVPDTALDRPLLARSRRRAGRRVEGVVAAQREESLVPGDPVAVTARDRRAQVVVDALAGDAIRAESKIRTWPSRKLSAVRSKLKCAVCAPE